MVDGHGLCLSLPPETRIGLLVEFKAPRQAIPNQDMSARLDVQAVASGCRVDQSHRKLSSVPELDILGILDIPQGLTELISDGLQVLDDTLPVMLEPIVLNEPFYIFPVDDIDQSIVVKRRSSGLDITNDNGYIKISKVLPFFSFRW